MEKLGSPDPACPPSGAGPVAENGVSKSAGDEEGEGVSDLVNSKLFCCACVRRLIPPAYREELIQVLKLTGPLLLSRILNFLLPFVITIFCGHIGNAALAGYALASATINVTTTATGSGLALACDTLISQTYGSKNMKRVGVILQRSSLILLLFCLPCWGLLINAQNLLLIMQQEEEVARIAQLYVMAFLPAVPAMFLHQLQVAYLQNQGIILPQMYTAAAANVVNVGVNYVLIFSMELGVLGSAIASSLSQVTICLMLFGYIKWKKLHKQTWGGWSTDCLQEWGSYMHLALPSVCMVCFEWWVWEVGGFLAGVLGEVDLAAQHVMVEIGAITYMFPLGVHAAACVRVGNALGAGNTARALVTCKVALVLSGVLALIQGVVIVSSKSVIGCIFTDDVNIVEIVSENLTVYTFVQLFDSILCICTGIVVGAGMQKIAALSNLVGYYCIGLPVGIALMFAAKLRTLGLWVGILITVSLQASFFLVLIFRLNWKKVTEKAQERAGKKATVIPKRQGSLVLNEENVPNFSDCPVTAWLNGEELTKADSYGPIKEEQLLQTAHETRGNHPNPGGANGDAEKNKNTLNSPQQTQLSHTQLVLRRGLILLISVLILFVGIGFHFVFPPPEPLDQSRDNFTQNWFNDSVSTAQTPQVLSTNL